MSNYNNVNLYDYNNNVIYPYVQLSSIQTDEFNKTSENIKTFPIYNYVTTCIADTLGGESNLVDIASQQIITGKKIFTQIIDGSIKFSEKSNCAEYDINGDKIDETYSKTIDVSTEINTINESIDNVSNKIEILENKSLDLSNYSGDVSIKVSNNFNITGDVSIKGNVYGNGFYENSDERIKTFKNRIDINLNDLSSLKKSYFIFNDDPIKEHIGVSAQEIQKLFPEIVLSGYDDNLLKVDYSKLSVIALAAIDKLYQENIELRNEIKSIKSHLNI